MKEIYADLYQLVSQSGSMNDLSYFVAMKGKKYHQGAIKLLLVGRAPNGWSCFDGFCSKNDFSDNALQEFLSTERVTYLPQTGQGWIEDHDGILRSHHGTSYCLNRSPFWSYSKEIWKNLYTPPLSECESVWMENIAWSNLYKISPRHCGNPSKKMMELQLPHCIDILKAEIDEWQPTHILLMTGYDWFMPFSILFEDVKAINSSYVDAIAKYKGSTVVIAKRPEYKPKQQYIHDIVTHFFLESSK